MNTNSEDNIEGKSQAPRRKVYSAEKDLYTKQLLKLKQQEGIIERGLANAMENMKMDACILQDTMHQYREISVKRHNFLSTLYKNMEDITSEVEFMKCMVKNAEEIKRLDTNMYKLKLMKLLHKMQDFEKLYCVQPLTEEQMLIDTELSEFESNLAKCKDVHKHAVSLSSCQNKVGNKNKQYYKDVEDFHSLVARTGHTEHWTMEDHLFFLKMRNRSDCIPALVAAMQAKCPDLSTEIIVNHEAWYKLYIQLREKQKSVVREWREKKQLEKVKSVDEVDTEREPSSNKVFEIKKKEFPKETEKKLHDSAGPNSRIKKELIMKWKIEKENKRSMDEEQFKIQTKLKREKEKSRRCRRQERIHKLLGEYKNKISVESDTVKLAEHCEEKGEYDSTLIKAFRKHDEEYTNRRKDLILRSRQSKKGITIAVKKQEFSKVRNYSTLLNSTKVWIEKVKVNSLIKHSDELRYIKDIPRISIRWRNEESEDLKENVTYS